MENDEFVKKKEGSAEFFIYHSDIDSIPSKSMNVFYNKKMEINRDVSNLAINAYRTLYDQEHLIIVDCMAASGLGSIRMLKECDKIKKIYINDINPIAVELIHKNLELNELNERSIEINVSKKDANFLFSEIAQDISFKKDEGIFKPNVISIDPFGTPNLYINSAFNAIQRTKGLICITATDTAVLHGVRKNACIRKYMSKSLNNEYCKEIGARILIYFVSRMANINKLGIQPLFTFSSSHFIRLFALTFKNKERISKFFKDYGYIVHCKCGYRTSIEINELLKQSIKCPSCGSDDKLDTAGPLWLGKIHNDCFLKELIIHNDNVELTNKKRIKKILDIALEEINMPISYYNLHKMCQQLKLARVPKIESLINSIKKAGYIVSRTHFDFLSFKTNMNIDLIKENLLKLQE